MKTKLRFFFLVSFIFYLLSSQAQVPQGFNYQAIARLTSGDPIINTTLPVRITIQADSLGTAIIWQELHSSVTTNGFGLLTLILGKGARQAASTVATFNAIDWTVTPKFIKTEINYSGWKTMGVTRFWSVPYSKIAENLGGPVKKLAVTGTTLINDEALFEVKNKDGYTVFAVYNEGVRVYVADGAKGLKGGFAVGGFGTDKAESQKYMVVSKDSVRIYLDTNPLTKGPKGGFAVGGYDLTKAPPQEFLRVTRDSTRIYINNNPAKGLKGGFAVGGFDVTKGPVTPFTSLTPKNYFIGHEGGQKITSGQYNSVIGYQSGKFITTGQSNAFLGYQSGFNNSTGTGNLFLGYQTGFSTTGGGYNSFVGYKSGYSNTSGLNNSFLGSFAGYSNTTGNYNTFVGDSVGYTNTIGKENSFYGDKSGFKNLDGANNVFLGNMAGYTNTTGDSSIFIGNRSGYSNTIGNANVFVGNRAGYSNTAGQYNVFFGYQAGYSNSLGDFNVLIGYKSGYSIVNSDFNTFIGHQSGYNSKEGFYNIFFGYRAGYNNSKGSYNIFIGPQAGNYSTYGDNNVFVGHQSGYKNTLGGVTGTQGDFNTFLGCQSGYGNITGSSNVNIGYLSGFSNTSGSSNLFAGYNSGYSNTEGSNNVFLGPSAGYSNTTGIMNLMIGYNAGYYNTTGNYNVFLGNYAGRIIDGGNSNVMIGQRAGYNNTTGSSNVYIGYYAGYNDHQSNRLYIENSNVDSTAALIWGNFTDNLLRFNSKVGIGAYPDERLLVKMGGSGWDYPHFALEQPTTTDRWNFLAAADGILYIGYNEVSKLVIKSTGNFCPRSHKGASLGEDGQAWDNVYYDDLFNQGSAAFSDRDILNELLSHPPQSKTPGMFDYKTKRGLEELDPSSLPVDLTNGQNYILTDEMTTYNYKVNYEQQVVIEKLTKEIESQNNKIARLEKMVGEMMKEK